MKISRLLFPSVIGAWGFWVEGWPGVFYALILWGIWLFVWYAFVDAGNAFANFMNRPRQHNVTVRVEDGAIKGHPDIEGTSRRHPDPTRPTEEDFAGLITYRIEKGRHG
jgi:hypothetical protein